MALAFLRRRLLSARGRPLRRRRGDMEFLPAAVEIVETPASPLGRGLLWAVCLLAVLASLWAWFGQVDTVAVANGRVIPAGRVKLIQPLEMGVVRAIHVEEGQRVRKGELLLELDATETQVDRDQIRREGLAARVEWLRLRATLRALDGENGELSDVPGADAALLETQRQRMRSELAAFRSRLASLDGKRAQLQAEGKATTAEIGKLDVLIPLLREQEQALDALLRKGVIPRPQWLEGKRQLVEAQQDRLIQRERLAEVEAGIESLRKERQEAEAEFRKRLHEQLVDAWKRLDQAELALRKAAKRESRNYLHAPVDGIVHQLAVHTVGGVVTPADPVMNIVPDGSPLEVEAWVLNKDIGFVEVGQEVEIKVESFPVTRYGLLKGEVRRLSADAVADEQLGSVYSMRVALAGDSLQVGTRRVRIGPGMAVTAEVKTGRRRIAEFFLSPLSAYRQEALRER